eukprot:gene16849-16663_t
MPPPSPPCVKLQIGLLGEIQLSVAGQPPAGKVYSKILALLAYLALESPRAHRREQLADLFWPRLPAEAARINLRQTLYHLRRILGASAPQLLTGRDSVRLQQHADWWLDVREFLATDSLPATAVTEHAPQQLARLEAATALYRGEFLANLELDDAAEFANWRDGWRASLHQHMLRLLDSLRDRLERQGASEQALQHARHYLALEPWNETAHRTVMRLLAACGRPAEALAQYANCQRLLQQELGSSPAEATRQLAEAIHAEVQQRELQALRSGPARAAVSAHGPAAPITAAMTTPAVTTSVATPAADVAFAERRQVTILHCSLSAADTDDAEDIAERLRQPYQHCAELVGLAESLAMVQPPLPAHQQELTMA